MNNLLKELESPSHNSEGLSIPVTNLHRRAANAIRQLLQVRTQNALVINTLQRELQDALKELEHVKNSNTVIESIDIPNTAGEHT